MVGGGDVDDERDRGVGGSATDHRGAVARRGAGALLRVLGARFVLAGGTGFVELSPGALRRVRLVPQLQLAATTALHVLPGLRLEQRRRQGMARTKRLRGGGVQEVRD